MNGKIDYLLKNVIPRLPNYIDLSNLESDFNLNQGHPVFLSKGYTDLETIKAYKEIITDLKTSKKRDIKELMIMRDALSANRQVISLSRLTHGYEKELEVVTSRIEEFSEELKTYSKELEIILELEIYLQDLVSSVYKKDYASV
jgi:hypothetical protein